MRTRIGAIAAIGALVGLAVPAAAFVDGDPVLYERTGQGLYYGWAVSELTDVDGDGVTDWISGSIGANGFAGYVEAVSGATGDLIFRVDGQPGELLSYGIADAGDTNADGVNDVVAGAPGQDRAYVYSGVDGALLLTLTGDGGGEFLGSAVGDAGDVDGDGHADILVGAENNGAAGANAGRVYVFSGADGSTIRTLDGLTDGDLFGSGTDGVSDVTGDGVTDHVVGARDAGHKQRGRVYVFSGADGSLVHELKPAGTGQDLGYFFVAGLNDVDGDGVADIYGGDFNDDIGGRSTQRSDRSNGQGPKTARSDTGRAYVWSGATGQRLHMFKGATVGAGMGPGRGAGDVDHDGLEDIIVGSYTSSAGASGAGVTTIFSGATGKALRSITNDVVNEQFGFDAVGLGDVDGDGEVDFLVSAANGDRVYVMAGLGAE